MTDDDQSGSDPMMYYSSACCLWTRWCSRLEVEVLMIVGEQFGVRVVRRNDAPNDAVQIISEDDGNWFEHGNQFDAGWIDDLISVLRAAQKDAKVTFKV